jgi:hypothetical protein
VFALSKDAADAQLADELQRDAAEVSALLGRRLAEPAT